MDLLPWLYGLAGSGLIAGAAYWKKSLSASGAAAAVVLGTAMFALGSAVWFGTLIAFFASSTLLSKWKRQRRGEAESGYEKGGRRDAGQVAANGLAGLLLCAANAALPHPGWLAAFLGVTAAVNADTWATELGGLSRRPPRSIVTGRRVVPGTSGGVTPLGTAASLGGALFIGAAALALLAAGAAVHGAPPAEAAAVPRAAFFAAAAAGGFVGALADSLLGATVQRMYRCRVCGRELERPQHHGQPAERIRGLSWMNNDAVNVLSSLAGGAVGWLAAFLFF